MANTIPQKCCCGNNSACAQALCKCKNNCLKHAVNYANISVPIDIKPKIVIHNIETECCGEPLVTCCKNDCKGCRMIISQAVCIKIQFCIGVGACVDENGVSCTHEGMCCE